MSTRYLNTRKNRWREREKEKSGNNAFYTRQRFFAACTVSPRTAPHLNESVLISPLFFFMFAFVCFLRLQIRFDHRLLIFFILLFLFLRFRHRFQCGWRLRAQPSWNKSCAATIHSYRQVFCSSKTHLYFQSLPCRFDNLPLVVL